MPAIVEDNTFTQVVQSEVDPATQHDLINALIAKAERWVRHRPGFVSSTFHASLDDQQAANNTQQRTEADFHGFIAGSDREQPTADVRTAGPEGGPHPAWGRPKPASPSAVRSHRYPGDRLTAPPTRKHSAPSMLYGGQAAGRDAALRRKP